MTVNYARQGNTDGAKQDFIRKALDGDHRDLPSAKRSLMKNGSPLSSSPS